MPRPTILTSRVTLLKYLDATAHEHNGNTGTDFVEVMDQRIRPTKKDIADLFNVSPPRIAEWIKIFDSKMNDKESKQ